MTLAVLALLRLAKTPPRLGLIDCFNEIYVIT